MAWIAWVLSDFYIMIHLTICHQISFYSTILNMIKKNNRTSCCHYLRHSAGKLMRLIFSNYPALRPYFFKTTCTNILVAASEGSISIVPLYNRFHATAWWRHKMETFSALLALCVGNSPVNSPHKGQWRRALMFSLICAWINGWVNNGEAGYLRRLALIMTSS